MIMKNGFMINNYHISIIDFFYRGYKFHMDLFITKYNKIVVTIQSKEHYLKIGILENNFLNS
jgi:hypothetical protein